MPICAYVIMAVSLQPDRQYPGRAVALGHAENFMSVGAFAGVVTLTTCLAGSDPVALRLAVAILVGGICARSRA